MSFFSGSKLWHRTSWSSTLAGRALSLTLTSGAGGLLNGGFLGASSWSYLGRLYSWWYWIGFICLTNALMMMIVGLFVGLLLFAGVALLGRSWSKQRRCRFSLSVGRLCRSLLATLFLTTVGSLFFWVLTGHNTIAVIGFGNWLVTAEMAMLPIASVLLVLVFSSKSGQNHKPSYRKRVALNERLLPID